jgi:hypothetical protein
VCKSLVDDAGISPESNRHCPASGYTDPAGGFATGAGRDLAAASLLSPCRRSAIAVLEQHQAVPAHA